MQTQRMRLVQRVHNTQLLVKEQRHHCRSRRWSGTLKYTDNLRLGQGWVLQRVVSQALGQLTQCRTRGPIHRLGWLGYVPEVQKRIVLGREIGITITLLSHPGAAAM